MYISQLCCAQRSNPLIQADSWEVIIICHEWLPESESGTEPDSEDEGQIVQQYVRAGFGL